MSIPETYTFTRYLAAKKSVDDRALNDHVWRTLERELSRRTSEAPLRILEVGAGIGTMVERLLDRGILAQAEYTALDSQAENVAHALQRLPRWASERDYQVKATSDRHLILKREGLLLAVEFSAIDLFDFIAQEKGKSRWDLLIAHAFLDLIDIPKALPLLLSLSSEKGLFYFSLNFDGVTALEPAIDAELDEHIQNLYHRSMDERITEGKPSGDSRSGRHLFTHLKNTGAQILDAGASDWVVFPRADGYPADEAYFLHFIIHTIQKALDGHPNLDAGRFESWVAERHAQISRSELVYIAHQLDFVGRVGQRTTPQ